MEKYLPLLMQCPLFASISSDQLLSVLACLNAQKKAFRRGENILAEGTKAKYLGILLAGKAQIIRMDYYGNRSIVAGVEPPELFGEAFACAGVEALPVNVLAVTDTEVLMIDAERITRTCSNACEFHNQIVFNLLRVVSRKNILVNQKIEITSRRTTREKLMAYLLIQARQNNSRSFIIPYNRQELADYLEVERSGLSAEIGKMKREGILDCHRSAFILKK